MTDKKYSKKTIPQLQKKADKTPTSINSDLERNIRNNTDYDNRLTEAEEKLEDEEKKKK